MAFVVKLAAHAQGGLAVSITGLAGNSIEMRLSMEQVEATGLMALALLAVVGADTGDWPESLPLRPANDGRLYTAEQFREYYGGTALEHWMTAGLRLREFKFIFDAAPAMTYSLDTNNVPAPVQAIVGAIFAPGAAAVSEGMEHDELNRTSVEVETSTSIALGEELESFDAEGKQVCGICCIMCSSLAQLHEHFDGLGHRRQLKWFVVMDAELR